MGMVVALAALGWQIYRGPDPLTIIARTEVPPAPVLAPADAAAAFRTAPGFAVELVAAEPLVVDPVAMDWDDQGRLYVVEMRGFMPNLEAEGEDVPSGRVVVLEDTDGDGTMDRSDVFADGLVLPRAVAVLPEGVLIGEPPNLWLCRDTDGDRACDEKTRLTEYGLGRHDPEHLENGLLPGIDGWIYNAKSKRRFRLVDGELEIESTAFRGQWGIAQDDAGRLYYNHNSAFVYGDVVPGEYATRQPATARAFATPGVGLHLSEGASVHGVRVAIGLNRAYVSGTLRPDGRQDGPTAVSGLVVQRGDQYGQDYIGDVFVPEPGSNAVAHFSIDREGLEWGAQHRLYPDADWGEREFLASTDERFRPVDAKVGPDGAIWVIDMYRGLIQHANYVSEHLDNYTREHDLEEVRELGRIWRIIRTDGERPRAVPSLDTLESQLAGLEHPNGWVRDRAQRRIVAERDPAAALELSALAGPTPLARVHAIWALEGLRALGGATWRTALGDEVAVRRAALRAGEPLLRAIESADAVGPVLELLVDPDRSVRVQAIHSLGEVPEAFRPLAALLGAAAEGGEIEQSAAISSMAGIERLALQEESARVGTTPTPDQQAWLAQLSSAGFLAARFGPAPEAAVADYLDVIDAMPPDDRKRAVLDGMATAQRLPGTGRFELADAHSFFDVHEEPEALAAFRRRLRRTFTWPGDPTPGGARALTAAESKRRDQGEALYEASCASCHGSDGRGQTGLAPPLAGSAWVRDSDGWLVRIALGGVMGPILVNDQSWNSAMPGHGHDPRFDDEGLAGVLTYLRRSWGHADEPVAPETVARIRAEMTGRVQPWTAKELLELSVDHRFDRYVGVYTVPVVSIDLEVARLEQTLVLGPKGSGKAEMTDLGDGLFASPELSIQFETDEDGEVSARATRDGTTFPLSRVN
jgi:mono/diheme cytochrome c family protein/glucose/arabinose dehydrogenase